MPLPTPTQAAIIEALVLDVGVEGALNLIAAVCVKQKGACLDAKDLRGATLWYSMGRVASQAADEVEQLV